MRILRLALVLTFFGAGLQAASALTYRLAPIDDGRCGRAGACRTALVGVGDITEDEIERFRAFVSRMDPSVQSPRDFVIHSRGGNLGGAMKLGIVLRSIGLRAIAGTVADGSIQRGFCGSACVFVLMGGRTRHVAPGSVVAVHAPRRIGGEGREDSSRDVTASVDRRRYITGALSQYARVMGVDPALIHLSMTIPHESGRVLSAQEIRRFRLTTGGGRR
ncbi:MAG TPA: hypothetical protein VIL09_05990 [Microvirga sp.]|jgi:hypothetical protein